MTRTSAPQWCDAVEIARKAFVELIAPGTIEKRHLLLVVEEHPYRLVLAGNDFDLARQGLDAILVVFLRTVNTPPQELRLFENG